MAVSAFNKEKVLIIIPVWNEDKKIGGVIQDLKKSLNYDLLVIDDGSTDNTSQEAIKAGANVIQHEKNLGVGAAIRTGIEYGKQNGYTIIVPINGTGKTKIEEIPSLIEPIIKENYDFVQGSRYLKGGGWANMPKHRKIGTKVYSFIFSLLVGKKITDGSSGIRAFKTSIVSHPRINLNQIWLNRYELEPYLYYKAVRLKFKTKEVPITINYPKQKNVPYTKMRPLIGWWSITRPIIYLRLGLKN
ncbi:MAG: glycosyltransferase family 2 protein [candidate division WOR-3 bacterium]|nr:glycosyltransferase family 2 protein [candidate division WOR-3 bacterium]